jgi:hypothetical protein
MFGKRLVKSTSARLANVATLLAAHVAANLARR